MTEPDLSPDEIAEFRAVLVARRDDLASLAAITEESRKPIELDQQSVGRLSRMDAIQQQAMAFAAEQRRRNEVHLIGAALKRIDEGEFGWCSDCGEAIPRKRLKIDATTAICVACANDR